jgi:hypothetical protein
MSRPAANAAHQIRDANTAHSRDCGLKCSIPDIALHMRVHQLVTGLSMLVAYQKHDSCVNACLPIHAGCLLRDADAHPQLREVLQESSYQIHRARGRASLHRHEHPFATVWKREQNLAYVSPSASVGRRSHHCHILLVLVASANCNDNGASERLTFREKKLTRKTCCGISQRPQTA